MTENLLLQYIRDCKRYPLLTQKDEEILADGVQNGDEDAINTLVTSNLRLVVKMAKRYSTDNSKIMELIQEGNMGLMRAARKFSKSYKVRFCSYASWWIRQSFLRYLDSSQRIIKLPVRKEALIKKLKREEEKYSLQHGTYPTCDYLAKTLHEPCASIEKLQSFKCMDIISLDAPLEDNDNASLYDLIPCYSYRPEKYIEQNDIKRQLDLCLEVLTEREKDVVISRYCFNGEKKPTSFAALGKKYSISAESIRQTQLRALRKLKANQAQIQQLIEIAAK